MPGAPVLKPREVIAILNALGFVEVRQRIGSRSSFSSHVDRLRRSCPRLKMRL